MLQFLLYILKCYPSQKSWFISWKCEFVCEQEDRWNGILQKLDLENLESLYIFFPDSPSSSTPAKTLCEGNNYSGQIVLPSGWLMGSIHSM